MVPVTGFELGSISMVTKCANHYCTTKTTPNNVILDMVQKIL